MSMKAKSTATTEPKIAEKLRNDIRLLDQKLREVRDDNAALRDALKAEQITVRALQREAIRLDSALEDANGIPF